MIRLLRKVFTLSMQLNNILTNLGVDSLDALSIVLLEELVSGQVLVVCVRVLQVDVGQAEVVADLGHCWWSLFGRRLDNWRWWRGSRFLLKYNNKTSKFDHKKAQILVRQSCSYTFI